MKPTRLTRGAISLSISSHFPPISASKIANPVMLPPGRAKLATKPLPTGSPTRTKRIGIVEVSFCRIAVTKLEVGTIRSGEALTSSLAKVRALSGSPPVHRMSIRMLRPFVHPSSWSRSWKADCRQQTLQRDQRPSWNSEPGQDESSSKGTATSAP